MKVTDQTRLLNGVAVVRELLDRPTTLSPADLKACREFAEKTADACHFNAGWYAGRGETGEELKGSASTKLLFGALGTITEYLQLHTKPRRGKGRPPVDALDPDYLPVLAAIALSGLEDDAGGKRHLVTQAIRSGVLQDKVKFVDGIRTTTSTDAHLKKIDRELKKLAKRRQGRDRSQTKNVLIFRPRKPAKTKNPTK